MPIPERPADDLNGDPESDEEGDEAPQIVVVREGKHVTKAEYERSTNRVDGFVNDLMLMHLHQSNLEHLPLHHYHPPNQKRQQITKQFRYLVPQKPTL